MRGIARDEVHSNPAERPLRICVVGDSGDTHVRMRTRGIAERGHAVRLVGDAALPLDGVDVVVPRAAVNLPKVRVIADLIAHARCIKAWRPDVVHVHYAHRIPSWMTGVVEPHPLVVTVMGGDVLFKERGEVSPKRAQLTRHLLESADVITTKSDFLEDAVSRLGPFRAKCVRIVWGVRKNAFTSLRSDPALRRSIGLEPRDRLVVSLRSLRPLYGVHLLVEAFPGVLRLEPRARLLILEYRPDPEYLQAVRDRVRELGIGGRVIFLPEALPEQIPRLLAESEVSVSLAASDGLPQTLLEALAAGVPTVLSRLDRYGSLVSHGESAYLVDRTPQAVSAGIAVLLGDDALRRRIAEKGRSALAGMPDFEEEVARLEGEYRRLVAGPRRNPTLARRVRGMARFLSLGLR